MYSYETWVFNKTEGDQLKAWERSKLRTIVEEIK